MELKGYDAETMRKVLEVIHSVSPLNGMVCVYVDDKIERLMTSKGLLWATEDGDVFGDVGLDDWNRRGGDVRELARVLDLDIDITL